MYTYQFVHVDIYMYIYITMKDVLDQKVKAHFLLAVYMTWYVLYATRNIHIEHGAFVSDMTHSRLPRLIRMWHDFVQNYIYSVPQHTAAPISSHARLRRSLWIPMTCLFLMINFGFLCSAFPAFLIAWHAAHVTFGYIYILDICIYLYHNHSHTHEYGYTYHLITRGCAAHLTFFYMYTYIYIHIYTLVYIYAHIYIYSCILLYINFKIRIDIYAWSYDLQLCSSCVIRRYIYTYIYIYEHVYIYTFIHLCSYIFVQHILHSEIHTCTFGDTCTHIYIYTYTSTYVFVHIFGDTGTHTYIYINIYKRVYIHTSEYKFVRSSCYIRRYNSSHTSTTPTTLRFAPSFSRIFSPQIWLGNSVCVCVCALK